MALCRAGTFRSDAQVTAQQQSAVRSNCRSDFVSKCSGVTPGGKEALACLQNNVAALSPACKTAVSATMPKPAPGCRRSRSSPWPGGARASRRHRAGRDRTTCGAAPALNRPHCGEQTQSASAAKPKLPAAPKPVADSQKPSRAEAEHGGAASRSRTPCSCRLRSRLPRSINSAATTKSLVVQGGRRRRTPEGFRLPPAKQRQAVGGLPHVGCRGGRKRRPRGAKRSSPPRRRCPHRPRGAKGAGRKYRGHVARVPPRSRFSTAAMLQPGGGREQPASARMSKR